RFAQGIGRRGEARVVEQEVDLTPWRHQVSDTLNRLNVAHVDFERQECFPKLLLKRSQPIGTTSRADHCPATAGKTPRSRLAESGSRSGDQHRLPHIGHELTSSSTLKADRFAGCTPTSSEP